MKRDMDLIRLILLDEEGEEKPDLSGYAQEQIIYHMALLIEAKLAHGAVVLDENGEPDAAQITRLTWEGHEFLDKARSETVWNKTKALAKEKGVSLSVGLLSGLLTQVAKQTLGL